MFAPKGSIGLQGFQGSQGNQGNQGNQGSLGDKGGIKYQFSTSTTNSDPGQGYLRFNHPSDPSAVSEIYIDNLDVFGNNLNSIIGSLFIYPVVGGTYGSYIYIQENGSGSIIYVYQVTNFPSSAGGYWVVPVGLVSGSLALPSNNQNLNILVMPPAVGYQGNQGNIGYQGQNGFSGSQGSAGAQGQSGYQGSSGGLQGSAGAQGSQGSQGSQGDKYAILPVVTSQGYEEYVELICVEMPEVRFEDIMVVKVGGSGLDRDTILTFLDDRFIQVCEKDTIKVTSAVGSSPVLVGAYISKNSLVVEAIGEDLKNKQVEIVVRISGIRKGRLNRRFAKHTYQEMISNTRFWEKWKESASS